METLWQDIRFGLRCLRKAPGFTLIAVLTLALGIGANTAIFSVVNAVVLQPLPFAEAERLVWVWGQFSQGNQASVSPPDFLDYRAQNHAFEELAAMRFSSFNLTGTKEPERLAGARITTNFFRTLGVQPILGRDFLSEEEQPGRAQSVILSEGVWQRRFAKDPAIIGQALLLDGKSYTVVGVVPNRSRLPEQAELWTPFVFDAPEMKIRRFHFLRPIARLKPGVTLQQAQADVNAVAVGLEKLYPDSNTSWRLRLVSLRQQLVGDLQQALYLLLGAVALVLLIGCANVANLLLSQAVARQKEIALRFALGAGRWRLVRQLLTESLLFALAGGLSGLFLAIWGTDLLVALAPDLPRAAEISVDRSVLIFSLAVSLLTGVIFGLVPALQASKPDLNEALKEGGKGAASGARHNRVRNLLVVSEVALSLLLLIGAGLLIQSFRRLQDVDPGFDPHNLLTLRTFLPEAKYPEEAQAGAFFERVIERVKGLPGVQAVGLTTHLPMRGGGDTYFTIEGKPFPDPKQKITAVDPRVSHDYFRAMGIPLIKGRHFTEPEAREPIKTVIINEAFVRTYFQNEEPLGRRLIIDIGSPLPCEIIGVARDIRQYGLASPLAATMYLPSLSQYAGNLVVRTAGDPLAIAADVERAVQAVDKDQPVTSVSSMEQILADSVAQPRFRTLLLAIFATMALLLAAVGIYGVMSYAVTQRTHEIGIRLALGAQQTDVLKLVVGQGLKLTLCGIVIGLLAAFALTRTLTTFLYNVTASDPLTFVLVSLLLAGVALVACYIPARRATKVDPMIALRYE